LGGLLFVIVWYRLMFALLGNQDLPSGGGARRLAGQIIPVIPMSQPRKLEFALKGTVAGKTISASGGVPFLRFAEFNDEVLQYLQGSESRAVLNDLKIQVFEGSYGQRVLIPAGAGILLSLVSDTAKLASSSAMPDIDPERAEVVLRWQERARMEPSLSYHLSNPDGEFAPVVVDSRSSFTRENKVTWAWVERFLIGEITDWGGAQAVNLHLRVRNSRETTIIRAKAEQIRNQRENLVFHKALVHVRAKQNLKTGELYDYELIDMRAYSPAVSDARLQELFDKGAKAWADVQDAGAWVEELRITEDERTLYKYCRELRANGETGTKPIKLIDGFDKSHFDPAGQKDLAIS
jgi:hypothetical protein